MRCKQNIRHARTLFTYFLHILLKLLKKYLNNYSIIFLFRYVIYKKYRLIGKFLNNNNFNPLITFTFINLMFLIDNCILYNNLLKTFYVYGISLNFLLYLELKGVIIVIFNFCYSLLISYFLKHLSFRC